MSKSMIGYIDRSAPAKPQAPGTVLSVMNRVYREAELTKDFLLMGDQMRQGFETEAFASAIGKLSEKDAETINDIIRSTEVSRKNTHQIKIRNIGRNSMTELVAKLGIWLNEYMPEKKG